MIMVVNQYNIWVSTSSGIIKAKISSQGSTAECLKLRMPNSCEIKHSLLQGLALLQKRGDVHALVFKRLYQHSDID